MKTSLHLLFQRNQEECWASYLKDRWIVNLCLTVVSLLASHQLGAQSEEAILSRVRALRDSPASLETVAQPRPCGEMSLTVFRQNQKIMRIRYQATETCVDLGVAEMDEFFDSTGNPLFVAYNNMRVREDEKYCGSTDPGQMLFSENGLMRTDCFQIAEASAHINRKRLVGKGIPACSAADLDGRDLGCYFASSRDVELFMQSALLSVDEGTPIVTTRTSAPLLSKQPEKGDAAHINANIVVLRQGPSTQSAVLRYLYNLDAVQILEKGKEERINPWGKYPWYRVEVPVLGQTGWVFGAFIDRPYLPGCLHSDRDGRARPFREPGRTKQ